MRANRSELDERQELVLLRIESRAFWIAYALLLAAILIQSALTGFDLKIMAGEWICFMVVCIYVAVECLRNGIWDRHLKPNARTNFLGSLIAGAIFGAIVFLSIRFRLSQSVSTSLAAGAMSGGAVFVLSFAALSMAAARVKKTRQKLDEEPEEEE